MRLLPIAAALLFLAGPALAQTADGRKAEASKAACHAAGGKPCPKRPARPAARAKIATPMISRCRDVISHQAARCGGPNAEPVPAN